MPLSVTEYNVFFSAVSNLKAQCTALLPLHDAVTAKSLSLFRFFWERAIHVDV